MTEQKPRIRDSEGRELILRALGTNLLVEAAAGTGKTTSMVGRIVELVATGFCEPERIAAVTFTRKAAGELRTRLREELENRLDSDELSGEIATRLSRALEQQGLGYIGTIHAFCTRLLRERPVEAGIDPDFSEMEAEEDEQWRMETWREYIAAQIAGGDSKLVELERMGIALSDLESSYSKFCDFPDVDHWPLPEEIEPPAAAQIDTLLAPRMQQIRRLLREFPADHDIGNDKLIPLFRQLARMYAQADKSSNAELAAILEICRPRTVVQKVWGDLPEHKKLARDQRDEWEDFCEREVEPLMVRWRGCRYALSLDVLGRAAEHYRRTRIEAGRLNFTDLLIAARDLLKNSAPARVYFSSRYTHLLVDEFQDTDPVQAEIMMLLTAQDAADGDDWTSCSPRPGSLFVVGDPKQSIYRFRRADIITYENVRRLIENSGGQVVRLWSNFRTRPEVVEWINGRFEGMFSSSSYSPEYVALEAARAAEGGSVERLWLDKAGSSNNTAVFRSEPRIIAAAVRDLLESAPDGEPPDVLVLTWKRKNLGRYSAALDALGIPNQVTGSNSLGTLPQVRLLWLTANAAANPQDPVATVALLRSEAFGFSDPLLYQLVRSGGEFNYRESLPGELESETAEQYKDAFARLGRYANWLGRLGPVPALERIASDMGLFAQAAASRGGNQRAGGLARALELVRTRPQARHSLPDALEVLRRLAEGELGADSMEARPGVAPPVRVMNVHKAKGLEAGVVFLADPTGGGGARAAEVHVDRAEGRSMGYLAIAQPNPFGGKGKILACHPDWHKLEEEEGKFLEAERVRLLYVAATRARNRLVISLRESRQSLNPWNDFHDALQSAQSLDYGPLERPWEVESTTCGTGAGKPPDLVSAWREVSEEKYIVRQAKEVALSGQLAVPGATGEHGTEWGSAVHSLLEAGARNPGADLFLLAQRILNPEQCKPFGIPAVVDTVASVLASDIWARAGRARRMLAETPFEFVREIEGRGTLVRGAVDLAFDEGDGWVLVDYKTDSTEGGRLEKLVEHYAPQLRLYANAWEAASGERVKEIGLNFIGPGLYITVD